jgi:AbrB family looped-hinge helix DNA binding protein
MPKPPDGKRFYGSITVSDRGQIVIPAEARRDFNIEVGDKLLVLGDMERGLALVKASMFLEKWPGMQAVMDPNITLSKDEKNEQ